MMEMEVPHDYTERPGGHTWDYWDNAIKYQLLFFADKMAERLPDGGP
jgi:putative tributyrin esterase